MIHAFGCSFTRYYWPSWADLINQVEPCTNYGLPGVGNKAIFTRVISALTRGQIDSQDRVIVQWSGHTRYDLWLNPGRWLQRGNVWNQQTTSFPGSNQPGRITDDFLVNLWSDQDALIQSLTLAIALSDVLKARGIEYCYHFMTDWRRSRLETSSHEIATAAYSHVLVDHWLALEDLHKVQTSWIPWLVEQRQQWPALLWQLTKNRPPAEDLHPEPRESVQYLQKMQSILKWSDSEWSRAQQAADQTQQALEQANRQNCEHPNRRVHTEWTRDNSHPGWPLFERDHIKYLWDNEPI